MNKKVVVLVTVVLAIVSCVKFSTQYQRIEEDRARLIDFVYEPAEAAPGDTVTLTAIFAGKELKPQDVDWQVSFKVVRTIYGADTAFDQHPIDGVVEQSFFSDQTSCMTVRFALPTDLIAQSPAIAEQWLSGVPESFRASVPAPFADLSKEELANQLNTLALLVAQSDPLTLARVVDSMPGLLADLPMIMQLFTVPIRIFANIKGDHTIRSDYSVSYNRRFASLPGAQVYENHNPVIDSVVIYKVKGSNLMEFDPNRTNMEHFRLFGTGDGVDSVTSVPVDIGFSYFIVASTKGRDTAVTLDDIVNAEIPQEEDFQAFWYFQMAPEQVEEFSNDDLMNIAGSNDSTGVVIPPLKGQIKNFTVWLQVTDSKLNILNRSQGSAVKEVRGIFSYSSAYLKMHP